jgi:hypothetical protein
MNQPPPSLEVGVAVLAVQLTEVIKDVTALQAELASHRSEHQQEKRDRASGRRWLIGVTIALLGLIGGLYPFLAQVLQHLHK